MSELVGQVLGEKFLLKKLLGKGGMGEVYLGEQLQLKRKVAIKVLHPWLSQDPNVIKRFEREATAASRVTHPNSVTVFDFGQDEKKQFYLVMEYLEGDSLEKRIAQKKRFSPEEAISILSQILSPLSACHVNGIIHRDVKPENILLCTQNGREQIKVLDYGIARLAGGPQVTKTGHIIGTPPYMAPEQITGDSIGPPTDIYAAGIIAYEMFVGHPPFLGKSHLDILRQHIKAPVPSFRTLLPNAKEVWPLEAPIQKALAKKTTDRFWSADQFRVSLEKALEESLRQKDSTSYRVGERRTAKVKASPIISVGAPSSSALGKAPTLGVEAPSSLGNAVTIDVDSPVADKIRSAISTRNDRKKAPTVLDETKPSLQTEQKLLQNKVDNENEVTAISKNPLHEEIESSKSGTHTKTLLDTPKYTQEDVENPLVNDPLEHQETTALRPVLQQSSKEELSVHKQDTALRKLASSQDVIETQQIHQLEDTIRPPTKELLLETVAESTRMAAQSTPSKGNLSTPLESVQGISYQSIARAVSAQTNVSQSDPTTQTILPEPRKKPVFYTDPDQSLRLEELQDPLSPVSTRSSGKILYLASFLIFLATLLIFFWPSGVSSDGVLIRTSPEKATIFLNGQALPTVTPIRQTLPEGTLKLQIKREGCEDFEGIFEVTKELSQIFIPLEGGTTCVP